jgi:hypothetical protein
VRDDLGAQIGNKRLMGAVQMTAQGGLGFEFMEKP